MLSRKLIKHQPKRRLITYTAALSILALSLGLAGSALAVHDENFELDGNIAEDAGGPAFDWASFFNASGAPSPALPDASRPGFATSGFDRDFATNANGTFNTSDGSTFSTGSKDTLPITPGWQCGFSSNVNSKTDVTNTYALSFTNAAGDEILYFGLERNANTGTGNVGFWFLQDAVSCETTASNEPFVGDHTDGDILVVSEFSNGGAVATIQAYKWEGGANGSLNPNAVASGASCSSALANDSICAEVNTGTLSGIPWLTANKQDGAGHSLRVSEFFEAGLNLTDEGLGGKCFNTFMGTTRSSTSLTATIFDFSLGQLGRCESSISSEQVWEPNDSATVSVTGASTWGGMVDFTLFEGSLGCTGTSVYSESVAVSNSTSTVSTTNDGDFVADATEDYSWLVEFTPDAASEEAGVTGDSHCETTSLEITN